MTANESTKPTIPGWRARQNETLHQRHRDRMDRVNAALDVLGLSNPDALQYILFLDGSAPGAFIALERRNNGSARWVTHRPGTRPITTQYQTLDQMLLLHLAQGHSDRNGDSLSAHRTAELCGRGLGVPWTRPANSEAPSEPIASYDGLAGDDLTDALRNATGTQQERLADITALLKKNLAHGEVKENILDIDGTNPGISAIATITSGGQTTYRAVVRGRGVAYADTFDQAIVAYLAIKYDPMIREVWLDTSMPVTYIGRILKLPNLPTD